MICFYCRQPIARDEPVAWYSAEPYCSLSRKLPTMMGVAFHHEILYNGDCIEIPDEAHDVNAVAINRDDSVEIHVSYLRDTDD